MAVNKRQDFESIEHTRYKNLFAKINIPENVFIIYGDEDVVYDDSFDTSWDGSFRFEYLRKGDYTLYVVDDSTSIIDNSIVNYDYPVFRHVTISSNNSTKSVDNFIIQKD